jgi:transposase
MNDSSGQNNDIGLPYSVANIAGSSVNGRRAYTSISDEKRGLIMHAIDSIGMSVSETARIYQVSRSTVSNIKRIYYAEGQRTAKKIRRGKRAPKLNDDQKNIIRGWIDNDCLLTLLAMKRACQDVFDVCVSQSTLSRVARSFHYTIKQTSILPERASTEAIIQSRVDYAEQYIRIMSRRNQMYFIDESGFNCSMRRRRGRALVGERAVVHVPAIRSKNFSLCAAYNINSMFMFEVRDHSYNTDRFVSFLADIITKFEEEGVRDAILIMDNVSFHHANDVRELVESSGHQLLFLPAYSPFLNPIENVFNQWKHRVKCAQPQCEDELLAAIQTAAMTITPEQCQNYFSHMETFIPRCLNRQEEMG